MKRNQNNEVKEVFITIKREQEQMAKEKRESWPIQKKKEKKNANGNRNTRDKIEVNEDTAPRTLCNRIHNILLNMK